MPCLLWTRGKRTLRIQCAFSLMVKCVRMPPSYEKRQVVNVNVLPRSINHSEQNGHEFTGVHTAVSHCPTQVASTDDACVGDRAHPASKPKYSTERGDGVAIPQQPWECKPEDYHFGGPHNLRPFATVPSSPRCLAPPCNKVRHESCNPITSHVREAAVGGFHDSYAQRS